MSFVSVIPDTELHILPVLITVFRVVAHIAVLHIYNKRFSLWERLTQTIQLPHVAQFTECLTNILSSEVVVHKINDGWLLAPERYDRTCRHCIIAFDAFRFGIDGFHAVPCKSMTQVSVWSEFLNEHILTYHRQTIVKRTLVGPLLKTCQDLGLGSQHLLLRIIVIKADKLYERVRGVTQTDGQQPVPIITVPDAGRHIFAIGTSVVHLNIAVLNIGNNSQTCLFFKDFLGESFFHRLAHGTHHPGRPCLIETFQQNAKTTIQHMINRFCLPTLGDIFK